MSNTPRTDAVAKTFLLGVKPSLIDYKMMVNLARQLETELAEARQQLALAQVGEFAGQVGQGHLADLVDELRQQLVERDARLERMRWHLTDCSMIAEQRGDAYLFDARDNHGDFYQSQALADVIDNTLTPSSALAKHDAEVRRKVLEEAAAYLERDDFYNSSGMAAETVLRRIAKGE